MSLAFSAWGTLLDTLLRPGSVPFIKSCPVIRVLGSRRHRLQPVISQLGFSLVQNTWNSSWSLPGEVPGLRQPLGEPVDLFVPEANPTVARWWESVTLESQPC